MQTDKGRRDDIRDEMLIDMARGIQKLLSISASAPMPTAMNIPTIMGRLESHIELLREAKK